MLRAAALGLLAVGAVVAFTMPADVSAAQIPLDEGWNVEPAGGFDVVSPDEEFLPALSDAFSGEQGQLPCSRAMPRGVSH